MTILEHASREAQVAGVADQVQFQRWDATANLPEAYDVITPFDVVHDAINPSELVRSIRKALRPEGRYVCLEINCADSIEAHAGPLGALFYSISILYCMTTSLAHGGEGLGTVGRQSQNHGNSAWMWVSAMFGARRSRIPSMWFTRLSRNRERFVGACVPWGVLRGLPMRRERPGLVFTAPGLLF